MIREGKFGFAEGVSLLLISNLATIYLVEPSVAVELGKNMAWLMALFTMVVMLLEYWIIISLMKRHQDTTIIEASEQLLGPYLGILCNLLFALYFIVEEAILIRRYGEALLTAALPTTPISVIMVTLTLAAIISCYYGLETIARVSRISITFIFGGIFILFMAVISYVDVTNLYPLWSVNPLKIIAEGQYKLIILSEGLLAAVIFHSFGNWHNFRSVGLLAISVSGIIRTTLIILLILALGVELASEKVLPFYNLSRLVSFGRFFHRAESVFLLTWAMVGFLKLSITLYASTVILARTFRLQDYRPLLWAVSLLCFSISIIPPDVETIGTLNLNYFTVWGLIPTIVLPFLLLVVSLVRKRERKQKHTSEAGNQ